MSSTTSATESADQEAQADSEIAEPADPVVVLADDSGATSPVVAQFALPIVTRDGYRGVLDVTWHEVREVANPGSALMLSNNCNLDFVMYSVNKSGNLLFQVVRYDFVFTPEQDADFPWPEEYLMGLNFKANFLASVNGGEPSCGSGTDPTGGGVNLTVDPSTGTATGTVDAYITGARTPNNPEAVPNEELVEALFEIKVPGADASACESMSVEGFYFGGETISGRGCRVVRES